MTIEVANESGVEVDEAAISRAAQHALDTMGVSPEAELSIMVVDVAQMTELHLTHMDLPGPTDVLSFPMDDVWAEPGNAPVMIGDVVLCPEVAASQAVIAGHSTADELAMLTTHGVLHLLGYDHEEPEEHTEMFGLQAELLASLKAGQ